MNVMNFTIHARVTFHNGKNLFFASGDLTTYSTDVLVNAADPKLDHGGGVAKAIVDAGQSTLQQLKSLVLSYVWLGYQHSN